MGPFNRRLRSGPTTSRRIQRLAGKDRIVSWSCPQPSVFSLLVIYEHDEIVVHLRGELDLAGRGAFIDCVARAVSDRPRRLVLEASALVFVDVIGATSLEAAAANARHAGVELVLDSPNDLVRRVLELIGAWPSLHVR